MSVLTAGHIIQFVRDALKWTDAEDSRFYGPLSMAYWDLCEITDWTLLRRQKSVAFSGSPVATPSRTIGVRAIVGADGTEYTHVEQHAIGATGGRKRWYYSPASDTATLTGEPSVQIVDANGAAATDTVTLHYWVYPDAIAGISDVILLPGTRALISKTVKYMRCVIEDDPSRAEALRQEYDAAVAEMLAKNQTPTRFGSGRK